MNQTVDCPNNDPIVRECFDGIMAVANCAVLDNYLTSSDAQQIVSVSAYVVKFLNDRIQENYTDSAKTPEEIQTIVRNVYEHWSRLVTSWVTWRPTIAVNTADPDREPSNITADMLATNGSNGLKYIAFACQPTFIYDDICCSRYPEPFYDCKSLFGKTVRVYPLAQKHIRQNVAWNIVDANWFNDVRWYVPDPDYSFDDNGKTAYEATYEIKH